MHGVSRVDEKCNMAWRTMNFLLKKCGEPLGEPVRPRYIIFCQVKGWKQVRLVSGLSSLPARLRCA